MTKRKIGDVVNKNTSLRIVVGLSNSNSGVEAPKVEIEGEGRLIDENPN